MTTLDYSAVVLMVIISSLMDFSVSTRFVPKWKKQACEIPASQNEHSHYVCDDDGDVKCLPGWIGDLCDVPKCRPGCDPIQGYCNRPGECVCKLGYYGERCNKCIPLPGCQHGYCNTSFECLCQDGWDGLFCSEPLCRLDCHLTRGYCDNPGECKCRLGWSGKTCKSCQVLPGCLNGYCEKPLECKCHPGYTGILCQTPICSKTCHKDRGYCRKPGECRCKVGWWGKNCEKCFPYPGCVNGTCNRPWECNCVKGWGGMLCDEKLNYCEENGNTCQNGAKCISMTKDEGSFRCMCREGTSGKNCEFSEYTSTTTNIPSTTVTTSESLTTNVTTKRTPMGDVNKLGPNTIPLTSVVYAVTTETSRQSTYDNLTIAEINMTTNTFKPPFSFDRTTTEKDPIANETL